MISKVPCTRLCWTPGLCPCPARLPRAVSAALPAPGSALPAWGGEADLVLYFKGHFSSTKSSQTRAAAGRRRMSNAVWCEAQAMPPQPLSPPWAALSPVSPPALHRAVGCREVPRGAEQRG